MGAQFNCPSCRRSLYYETNDPAFQTCGYCKSKIIVPSLVVHEANDQQRRPTAYTLREQRNIKLAEIQSELSAGRKIEAIKNYSDSFGTDLATSKNAVEMIQQGRNLPETAIKKISLEDVPIEEKIYGNAPVQGAQSNPRAKILMWIIILIGIAIAFANGFFDN